MHSVNYTDHYYSMTNNKVYVKTEGPEDVKTEGPKVTFNDEQYISSRAKNAAQSPSRV